MMDLDKVRAVPRLLLEANLAPRQGDRFQPTGFPDLGPATYTKPDGTEMLLVESSQSMANRLEKVCWDEATGDLVAPLQGIPYVLSDLEGGSTTNSVLDAHRLNSPYIINDDGFRNRLVKEFGLQKDRPIDYRKVAAALFRFDAGSVLHGVFLAKGDIAGGRCRLARALSAFIEAGGVTVVSSGGVKFDVVNPGGDTSEGYGHVPYSRTEFAAKSTTAYFNLDVALLTGYGLGEAAERLLISLSLYKIARFLDRGLRLRTACDLKCASVRVTEPAGMELPTERELEGRLKEAIGQCRKEKLFADPPVTRVKWTPSKKAKDAKKEKDDE